MKLTGKKENETFAPGDVYTKHLQQTEQRVSQKNNTKKNAHNYAHNKMREKKWRKAD